MSVLPSLKQMNRSLPCADRIGEGRAEHRWQDRSHQAATFAMPLVHPSCRELVSAKLGDEPAARRIASEWFDVGGSIRIGVSITAFHVWLMLMKDESH